MSSVTGVAQVLGTIAATWATWGTVSGTTPLSSSVIDSASGSSLGASGPIVSSTPSVRPSRDSTTPSPPSGTFPHPSTESRTVPRDHCATAQYTLIDYGPTAFLVPFIGCMNSQPGCCQFNAAPSPQGVYPQPEDERDATLRSCPVDYYSISRGCCPNAYLPWTTLLGGRTPCYSTLSSVTTPPPITADVTAAATATTTTKPTVTVTGTVFAMKYAVQDPPGAKLSRAAVAGIAVGAICGVAALFGLWMLIRRCRKNARRRHSFEQGLGNNYFGLDLEAPEVPLSQRVLFRDWARSQQEQTPSAPSYRYPELQPISIPELPPRPGPPRAAVYDVPAIRTLMADVAAGRAELKTAHLKRASRGILKRVNFASDQGESNPCTPRVPSNGNGACPAKSALKEGCTHEQEPTSICNTPVEFYGGKQKYAFEFPMQATQQQERAGRREPRYKSRFAEYYYSGNPKALGTSVLRPTG
ncbi:hypothetical protein C8A03DRAFT_33815, partial [Achaetomium macrosporum]